MKVSFDKFNKISVVNLTQWNNIFLNSILLENLSKYISIYLVSPYKVLAQSNVRFDMYVWSRKIDQ